MDPRAWSLPSADARMTELLPHPVELSLHHVEGQSKGSPTAGRTCRAFLLSTSQRHLLPSDWSFLSRSLFSSSSSSSLLSLPRHSLSCPPLLCSLCLPLFLWLHSSPPISTSFSPRSSPFPPLVSFPPPLPAEFSAFLPLLAPPPPPPFPNADQVRSAAGALSSCHRCAKYK